MMTCLSQGTQPMMNRVFYRGTGAMGEQWKVEDDLGKEKGEIEPHDTMVSQ